MYSTYAYSSLQFPAEMNTGGSKTPTTFIPFHTNDDFRGRLLINNELNSLQNTVMMTWNIFTIANDL